MTMVFFLYTDCYTASVDTAHPDQLRLLLPNLVFVLAVLLYAVFNYMPPPDEPVRHIETDEAETP